MTTYNGHKNWNYWNVSLWINNDEGLYNVARDLVRRYGRKEAARRIVATLPDKTPDGAKYSKGAVFAALEGM